MGTSPRPEDPFEEFAREFIRRHEGPRPLWSVERVLVATDFSLPSMTALEYAEELARSFSAELLLLHAEEMPLPGATDMKTVTYAPAARELEGTAQQLRNHHVKVRTLLCAGPAADEIVNAAEREKASLIVMGTHGRTGVAHVLMGSVAERVVRAAPCPVLTVRPRRDR